MGSVRSTQFASSDGKRDRSNVFAGAILTSYTPARGRRRVPEVGGEEMEMSFFVSSGLISLHSCLIPGCEGVVPVGAEVESVTLLFGFFSQGAVTPGEGSAVALPHQAVRAVRVVRSS